jgi:hypothetical protein
MATTTRRNRTDLTLRNLTAIKRRFAAQDARLAELEEAVGLLLSIGTPTRPKRKTAKAGK